MFHCKPISQTYLNARHILFHANQQLICLPLSFRTCNACEDNADCNLNGVCNNNGECECKKEEGVSYFGERCEIKLKDECRNITAAVRGNSTWSTQKTEDGVLQEYSRPVYTYVEGLSPIHAPKEDDNYALMFSGSRYFVTRMLQANNKATSAFYEWHFRNFHGFWYVLRF